LELPMMDPLGYFKNIGYDQKLGYGTLSH